MGIIEAIANRPDGDVLCIIQAAVEMPADLSVEDQLCAGYKEVTGEDA